MLVTAVGEQGSTLTVTMVVVKQPDGMEYVMDSVPAPTPYTIPVEAPTVAFTPLLLHEPPAEVSFSVVVWPRHKTPVPVIGAGNGYTAMEVVVRHPPPME